jgi:hypothetical protein
VVEQECGGHRAHTAGHGCQAVDETLDLRGDVADE